MADFTFTFMNKEDCLAALTRVTVSDVAALAPRDRACRGCRQAYQRQHMCRPPTGELPVRLHAADDEFDCYMCEPCARQHLDSNNTCPHCNTVLYHLPVPFYRIDVCPMTRIPQCKVKVDAKELHDKLSERYWRYFNTGRGMDGPTEAVRHPYATLAYETVGKALMKMDGKTLSPVEFVARLEDAVVSEPQFRNMHRRSMRGGDLPKGMLGYIMDLVEALLRWFVPQQLQRRREASDVVRKERLRRVY